MQDQTSGYYAWQNRPASKHQRDDMIYLAHIRSAFRESNGTYGSPRMTVELQDQGLGIGRRRVARLMKDNGMQARQKRRFKCTTDSQHNYPIYPNLLQQDFTASRPNEKWGVDISYIWTREGWLYLAVVIDLYARRVVGHACSDRGSQYCSYEYRERLKKYGMKGSMSAKGNCYGSAGDGAQRGQNAVVETFFKTIKTEMIWRTSFATRRDAENMIGQYINGFYNPKRRHATLNYLSPMQFENHTT